MNKTTIHDQYQVIKYLYGDTSVQETIEMETLSAIDSRIYQEITEMNRVKMQIEKIMYCPRITTLKNILAYSK